MATKCPKCDFDNTADSKFCKECGTQLGSPDSPSGRPHISKTMTLETPVEGIPRGTLFAGRYEIIEELGTGGMGSVYRAEDTKIGQEVALKLIRPEIASSRRTIERFRNEIKTARMIAHRNVCRMFDLGEEKGTYFITMEYVSGEDMKSFLRRAAPLSPGRAISIGKQICEGLAEAHRLGVVHRDLKPGNIMIDKDGNARIMDFGIARSIAEKGITGTGVMIGTPEYMSPEQAEGKEADQRSDIYSLGVILFEMVTGRLPFEGETALSIAQKHRYEPASDPRALNAHVPEDLSSLILHCLEKDKETRYQTAPEVLAELEKIEQQVPSTDRVTSTKRPFTSKEITVKFTPKKLLIPAVALILIAAVTSVFLLRGSRGKEPATLSATKSIAVLPFTDLSQDKDQAIYCEGIAQWVLDSLANVKSLRVLARYSSFQFTAQDDPREVGKKLNADKILTGSLWKSGDRFRITVQMVDAAMGTLDWSEPFDGETKEEIFDIQDRIAATIVGRMNVDLLGDDKKRLEKRYTNNPEAYDLYLKGNSARWISQDDILKAVPFYLEAVQKDPAFALAYIALARCYKDLAFSYEIWPKEKGYKLSKEALDKAFALDNENGEAFAIRAGLKFYYASDPAGADRDYQRAFQLSPRNPAVLRDRFWYLVTKGRKDEAFSEAKLLSEVDPLDPVGYLILGIAYYCLRRYDDSIGAYQKALAVDPVCFGARGWSVYTHLAQGHYEKARDAAKYLEHTSQDNYLFVMAIIEGSSGNREGAEKYRKAFNDYVWTEYEQPVPRNYNSAVYAALGDRDRTLESLNQHLVENPNAPVQYLFWHFFDKYRSDPEFIAFFKKVGFEMK